MLRIFFFHLAILFTLSGRAQPSSYLPADSSRLFSLEEYFDWILAYHPLVQQANLLTDAGRANLRMARGGFDPKLYSDWEQKSFGEKEYFTLGESGLKVPSWYGLEFKAAFTTSSGVFLNPENNLPVNGQAILGVKATVGRGLFIDERRAALQQARLLESANEAERQSAINDVLLAAADAYWNWTVAYNQLLVYERALNIAGQRLEGIVESYRLGDKPAIDTLETFIQYQNREFDLNQALLEFRNAGLHLSNYLWLEGNIPLEVGDDLRPPVLNEVATQELLPPVEVLLNSFDQRHPDLRAIQLKRSSLEVDRRLAAEQLKPQLDLEYNLLGNGTNLLYSPQNGDISNPFGQLLAQNYKWGLQFKFPIFLRKERGKLDLTRVKISDTELKLQQKRLELANKVRNNFNELENTQTQIRLYASITENYNQLLQAEIRKFAIGESSIFLINAREQKLIEAQLKLAELQGKFFKGQAKLEWAAGRLWDQ